MAFNKDAYDAAVLRPLRRRREPLREVDLLDAFALSGYMTQAQVSDRMRDVRARWAELVVVFDQIKHVCNQLIQLDQAAHARYGADLETIGWWRARGRLDPATSGSREDDPFAVDAPVPHQRIVEPPVTDPRTVTEPTTPESTSPAKAADDQTGSQQNGWGRRPMHEIRRQAHDRDRTDRSRGPSTSQGSDSRPPSTPQQRASVSAQPEPGPARRTHDVQAASRLLFEIRKVTTEGSAVTVRASWVQPEDGHVEVRSSDSMPESWQAGDLISPAAMRTYGTPERADVTDSGQRRSMTAEMETGYRVFVPFIVRDGTVVVGQPQPITVARRVESLEVTRDNGDLFISWMWPHDCAMAEVEIRAGDSPRTREVSATAPGERGSLIVAGSDGAITVAVRTIEKMPDLTAARGQAEIQEAPSKPAAVSWQPTKRAGKVRACDINVTADRDCPGIRLIFVASLDRAMPDSPTDPASIRVHDVTVDLIAAVTQSPWNPRDIHRARPHWLRCFIDGGPAMVDPPIEYMKAG